MPYRLPDDLSYCRVDEHIVFLDTRRDRYFRLSTKLERAFLAYIDGGHDPEIDADDLIARNILVADPAFAMIAPATVERPTRSAVEGVPHTDRLRYAALSEILVIVCGTRLKLATRNLSDILTELTVYRDSRISKPSTPTENDIERLSDAASAFWRARLYVPIKPLCLLDSLSMVKFLAKRHLFANIVFGVTSDPFTAHSWVQYFDFVLSDTLGHATAHTPIRVV